MRALDHHRTRTIGPRRARALLAAVLAAALAPWPVLGADDDAAALTNLALLDRALTAAARELVAQAPLTPGTRVALQTEGQRPLDRDVEQALMAALIERRVEAYSLRPATPPPPATPADSAKRQSGAQDSGEQLSGDLASAEAARRRLLGQQEGGESAPPDHPLASPTGDLAAATGDDDVLAQAVPSHPVTDGLPVLRFTIEQARIDYVRSYRSGLFGGQQVRRRAVARISARLLRPQTRAVYWVGAGDTSFTDVVPRGELLALEDASRTELRGTLPQQNWTKVAEPALVLVLVAGLVGLFYTNRP